jgi:hypothetical protein
LLHRAFLSLFCRLLLLVLALQAFLRLLGRLLARPTLLSSRHFLLPLHRLVRLLPLRLLALFVLQRCLLPSLAPLPPLLALLVPLSLDRPSIGLARLAVRLLRRHLLLDLLSPLRLSAQSTLVSRRLPFSFLLCLLPLLVLRRRLFPRHRRALLHRRRPSPSSCLLLVVASSWSTMTTSW